MLFRRFPRFLGASVGWGQLDVYHLWWCECNNGGSRCWQLWSACGDEGVLNWKSMLVGIIIGEGTTEEGAVVGDGGCYWPFDDDAEVVR